MENFDLIPFAVIAVLFAVKFAVIIGVVLWSKSNQKKKRELFLAQQQRLADLRASKSESF